MIAAHLACCFEGLWNEASLDSSDDEDVQIAMSVDLGDIGVTVFATTSEIERDSVEAAAAEIALLYQALQRAAEKWGIPLSLVSAEDVKGVLAKARQPARTRPMQRQRRGRNR